MPASRILGPDGQPMTKEDLTREIASVSVSGIRRRYQDAIAAGLNPDRLKSVLRAANDGNAHAQLTLAEEMEERDPHYAAVLGVRKRAVLGLERLVESASDDSADVQLADAVRDYLVNTPVFGRLLASLLDAIGKGYSAVEVRWDTTQTPWAPRNGRTRLETAYTWRDPRFFTYDRATGRELRLLDDTAPVEGLPLPPYRFVIHEPAIKMGLPIRGGLARLAATACMVSMLNLSDWLSLAEIFGLPMRLGRYPDRYAMSNSKEATDAINELKNAVFDLGTDAGAVLPESLKIEFQSAVAGVGGADLFSGLADYLQKLISKAVLGRSDAADATPGKLGGETASSEVRRDILESDAEELQATINGQLVRPFIDLNFGQQARYPAFKLLVPNQEDLTVLVTMLEKMVPLGMEVEQSVIRDKWGLPDPAKGAKLLGVKTDIPPVIPATNRAANRAQTPTDAGGATTDPTAPLVDRMDAEAEPLIDALLQPVRDLMQSSGSLEGFRDALLGMYPSIPPNALASLMGQALAVAEATGRFEAQP